MKRSVPAIFAMMFILSILIVSTPMAGDVPNTLNYQGRLTDNTGTGVSGTKSITFSLYNVPNGGTVLWTENQTVTLSDGRFSVVLGNTTPLETNDFTGETYIGIQVDTDAEMTPRQKFTSVPYALKSGDGIPKGVIVMWSGTTADVPDGWALCDGVERTLPDGTKKKPPNLKDRFVIGAGNIYPVGQKLGEATHTLLESEMPVHKHTASSSSDTHNHPVLLENDRSQDTSSSSSGRKAWNSPGYGSLQADTTYIANDTHTHTITINNTGSGNAHNNLPPYYALCFIMKLY